MAAKSAKFLPSSLKLQLLFGNESMGVDKSGFWQPFFGDGFKTCSNAKDINELLQC